jgi:hypothetical protein
MKTSAIFLPVLIAMTIRANAQIPNNGFENWTTKGGYENPTGWGTMNSIATGPFFSCTKSTDHFPVSVGNFSIRLENNTSLTQWTGGYGIAMTDPMAYPFQPAFPIVSHPNSLCGYYKYYSLNNDSMFIRILFFERGIMRGDDTFVTGTTTSTWTSFTLPITNTLADSASIWFSAFYPNGPTDGPKGNSVLYVDNLSFDNLSSSVHLSSSGLPGKFNLAQNYPNPFNPSTTISFSLPSKSFVSLRVFDLIGREVTTIVSGELSAGHWSGQWNSDGNPSGIYFYRLQARQTDGGQAGDYVETKKMVLLH